MNVAQLALIALCLVSGCVRFGYDVSRSPRTNDAAIAPMDAAPQPMDAAPQPMDASAASDASPLLDAAAAGSGNAQPDAGQAVGGTGYSNGGAGGAGSDAAAGSGGMAGSQDVAGAPAAGSDAGVLVDAGLSQVVLSGFYSGPYDELLLREMGGEIWGAYTTNSGTIVGTITGQGVFQGWLSETPSRDFNAGEVELRWSNTSGAVTSLKGRWRWGTNGNWTEGWDFDRVTDRQAPSGLSSRFDDPSNFRRHP